MNQEAWRPFAGDQARGPDEFVDDWNCNAGSRPLHVFKIGRIKPRPNWFACVLGHPTHAVLAKWPSLALFPWSCRVGHSGAGQLGALAFVARRQLFGDVRARHGRTVRHPAGADLHGQLEQLVRQGRALV